MSEFKQVNGRDVPEGEARRTSYDPAQYWKLTPGEIKRIDGMMTKLADAQIDPSATHALHLLMEVAEQLQQTVHFVIGRGM